MNRNKPLISIIVPIYNVELYLKECIESIINQTYKNIEIILIDDGSPDNCGAICDEYAKKDNRIKVIHKENEGVSAARNTGIESCRGEYISFIDADDFVHPDFINDLYSVIDENNSDISFCDFYRYETGAKIPTMEKKESRLVCYDKFEMLKKINQHNFTNFTVDKLYKRDIFDVIRFPAGRSYFEDASIIYKIIDMFDKIYGTSRKLYYYRDNPNSAMRKKFNKSKFYFFNMIEEKMDYYKKKDYVNCYIDTIKAYIERIIMFNNQMHMDGVDSNELIKINSEKFVSIYPEYKKYKKNFSLKFRLKVFLYKNLKGLYTSMYVVKVSMRNFYPKRTKTS